MKIGKIEFIFENCEVIEIDGKYVGDFLIDDIHTYIGRIASNHIGEMTVADTVVVELHKDANKTYYPHAQEKLKMNTFDRFLEYKDITQIDFTLIDQYAETEEEKFIKEYSYYVNYADTENYWEDNSYQKVLISELGNLYLVISKDKNIEDFFNVEQINDEETMDYIYNMCDVGDKYGNPNRYTNED